MNSAEFYRLLNSGALDADYVLDDSDVRSVYLLRSGKLYKIGYAKSVQRRLASMRCGSARRIELVLAIKTEDYKALEAAFHALFRAKRHRGEWFELDTADVRIMRSYTSVNDLLKHINVNDPRVAQAKALKQSGASGREIAQQLSVSASTASRWINTTAF